jgi:phosphatidylserine/phosphatidylglycerophosphate/cardiolipin synthase-like enzyme
MKILLSSLSLIVFMCMASLGHADTKVYFSPAGGCQEAVIAELGKAKASIDVAMFSFTSREIAQALLKAKDRGVKIRISLDKAQIKEKFSKSRYLSKKGVNVKFHMGIGIMHDKFAVIDDKIVLSGSFNWTVSAEKKNAENLLVITDKKIAEKYKEQFKLLWSHSGEGGFKEEQADS